MSDPIVNGTLDFISEQVVTNFILEINGTRPSSQFLST